MSGSWQSPPSEHDQLAWIVEHVLPRVDALEEVAKKAQAVVNTYPRSGPRLYELRVALAALAAIPEPSA